MFGQLASSQTVTILDSDSIFFVSRNFFDRDRGTSDSDIVASDNESENVQNPKGFKA